MKSTIITAVAAIGMLNISGVAAQSTDADTSAPQESSNIQQPVDKTAEINDVITTDEQISSEEIEQLEAEVKALEAEVEALEESTVVVDSDTPISEEEELGQEVLEEVVEPLPEVSIEESAEPSETQFPENEIVEPVVEEATTQAENTESDAYNFERPIPQEGDIFIPVYNDARVFAEFIDTLPAVVNYYTYATEEEIIAFYTENYGEPVDQERKRGRLTVIYYFGDVSTRVVISPQDEYRQVDVLQENAAL